MNKFVYNSNQARAGARISYHQNRPLDIGTMADKESKLHGRYIIQATKGAQNQLPTQPLVAKRASLGSPVRQGTLASSVLLKVYKQPSSGLSLTETSPLSQRHTLNSRQNLQPAQPPFFSNTFSKQLLLSRPQTSTGLSLKDDFHRNAAEVTATTVALSSQVTAKKTKTVFKHSDPRALQSSVAKGATTSSIVMLPSAGSNKAKLSEQHQQNSTQATKSKQGLAPAKGHQAHRTKASCRSNSKANLHHQQKPSQSSALRQPKEMLQIVQPAPPSNQAKRREDLTSSSKKQGVEEGDAPKETAAVASRFSKQGEKVAKVKHSSGAIFVAEQADDPSYAYADDQSHLAISVSSTSAKLTPSQVTTKLPDPNQTTFHQFKTSLANAANAQATKPMHQNSAPKKNESARVPNLSAGGGGQVDGDFSMLAQTQVAKTKAATRNSNVLITPATAKTLQIKSVVIDPQKLAQGGQLSAKSSATKKQAPTSVYTPSSRQLSHQRKKSAAVLTQKQLSFNKANTVQAIDFSPSHLSKRRETIQALPSAALAMAVGAPSSSYKARDSSILSAKRQYIPPQQRQTLPASQTVKHRLKSYKPSSSRAGQAHLQQQPTMQGMSSNLVKRQKDILDSQLKPKQNARVRKQPTITIISDEQDTQPTAGVKTHSGKETSSEITPILMGKTAATEPPSQLKKGGADKSSGFYQSENSARQLFKAKKLVLERKLGSAATIGNAANYSSGAGALDKGQLMQAQLAGSNYATQAKLPSKQIPTPGISQSAKRTPAMLKGPKQGLSLSNRTVVKTPRQGATTLPKQPSISTRKLIEHIGAEPTDDARRRTLDQKNQKKASFEAATIALSQSKGQSPEGFVPERDRVFEGDSTQEQLIDEAHSPVIKSMDLLEQQLSGGDSGSQDEQNALRIPRKTSGAQVSKNQSIASSMDSSTSSSNYEAFQTEDRSPIATVPQVKTRLQGFAQKQLRTSRLPKRMVARQSRSTSPHDQPMFLQQQFGPPSANHQSLFTATNEQGAISTQVKNQQHGEQLGRGEAQQQQQVQNQSERQDLDTSQIPQEDLGTQKSANILQLQSTESNRINKKPQMMSPRQSITSTQQRRRAFKSSLTSNTQLLTDHHLHQFATSGQSQRQSLFLRSPQNLTQHHNARGGPPHGLHFSQSFKSVTASSESAGNKQLLHQLLVHGNNNLLGGHAGSGDIGVTARLETQEAPRGTTLDFASGSYKYLETLVSSYNTGAAGGQQMARETNTLLNYEVRSTDQAKKEGLEGAAAATERGVRDQAKAPAIDVKDPVDEANIDMRGVEAAVQQMGSPPIRQSRNRDNSPRHKEYQDFQGRLTNEASGAVILESPIKDESSGSSRKEKKNGTTSSDKYGRQVQNPQQLSSLREVVAERERQSQVSLGGLGQLFETARTSFKRQGVGNHLNPMLESIKKSFQSIIGSGAQAPGGENASGAYGHDTTGGKGVEESKSSAQLVVFDDMHTESYGQLKTLKAMQAHEYGMRDDQPTVKHSFGQNFLTEAKAVPSQSMRLRGAHKKSPSHDYNTNSNGGSFLHQANQRKKDQTGSRDSQNYMAVSGGYKRRGTGRLYAHLSPSPKARINDSTLMSLSPVRGIEAIEAGSRVEMSPDSQVIFMGNEKPQVVNPQQKLDSKGDAPLPRLSMTKMKSTKEAVRQSVAFSEAGYVDAEGSPSDCLLQFGHMLTQHEKMEILSYKKVYFVGNDQAKQIRKSQMKNLSGSYQQTQAQLRERNSSKNSTTSPPPHTTNQPGSNYKSPPSQSTMNLNSHTKAQNVSATKRQQSMSRSRGGAGSSLRRAMYGGGGGSGTTLLQGSSVCLTQTSKRQQVGTSRARRGLDHRPPNNKGYDTATGFYQAISGDHLAYRYEIVKELGRGTFGQVLLCKDHKTGEQVAVKVSKNLSQVGLDNCMREVRLLEQSKSVQTQFNARVVVLLDKFRFRQHLCMVFELLGGSDLYREIKNGKMQGLQEISDLKRTVQQILEGLCHLKECGIVHCDLKPENILYTSDAKDTVKIVDLGSACSRQEKGFSYVCSRYYRAPEMVLNKRADYDYQADMWSLGCITAELYNGLPLFLASSQNELIEFQSLFCGPFDRSEVLQCDGYRPYLDVNSPSGVPVPIPDSKPRYTSVKPKSESSITREVLCRKKRSKLNSDGQVVPDTEVSLDLPDEEILNRVSQEERLLVDFIEGCLCLKPSQRLTCEEALMHPFIAL